MFQQFIVSLAFACNIISLLQHLLQCCCGSYAILTLVCQEMTATVIPAFNFKLMFAKSAQMKICYLMMKD